MMDGSTYIIMNLCKQDRLDSGQPSGCFYTGIIDAKTVLERKRVKGCKKLF